MFNKQIDQKIVVSLNPEQDTSILIFILLR